MGSLEDLRRHVEDSVRSDRPIRWLRVNTVKSSVGEQLETTFKNYTTVSSPHELVQGCRRIYLDHDIPDLISVSPDVEVAELPTVVCGELVIQDKASCLPAFLLDPQPDDDLIIDACAAPGNKTTHLAALVKRAYEDCQGPKPIRPQEIHAFEKNASRSATLQKMVKRAGAAGLVTVHAGTDFLTVDPNSQESRKAGAILLDPSCSGSGLLERNEPPKVTYPKTASGRRADASTAAKGREGSLSTVGVGTAATSVNGPPRRAQHHSQKLQARVTASKNGKQGRTNKPDQDAHDIDDMEEHDENDEDDSDSNLPDRLRALSAFQLRLLTHALSFPSVCKVVYSTCSVHAEENERVVMAALASPVAREGGWTVLPRERQRASMRDWPGRGILSECGGDRVVADACIRTRSPNQAVLEPKARSGQNLIGFFVVAFVREDGAARDAARRIRGWMPGMVKWTEAMLTARRNEEFVAKQKGSLDFTATEEDDSSFKESGAASITVVKAVPTKRKGRADPAAETAKRSKLAASQEKGDNGDGDMDDSEQDGEGIGEAEGGEAPLPTDEEEEVKDDAGYESWEGLSD